MMGLHVLKITKTLWSEAYTSLKYNADKSIRRSKILDSHVLIPLPPPKKK